MFYEVHMHRDTFHYRATQQGNILFLIDRPHRLPDSFTFENTIQLYMYHFCTEYDYRSHWKTQ